MSSRRTVSAPVRSDAGAVLIFVAMLLVIIFGAVAFVVDIGRFAISQADHKRAASAAALAGLAEYWRSGTREGDMLDRTARAVWVANQSAAEFGSVRENHPTFSSLPGEERTVATDNTSNFEPSPETGGVLRFGFWHYREPAGSCKSMAPRYDPHCPCVERKWIRACFERQDPKAMRELATAIQLEIFTPLTSPFHWSFAGSLGILPAGIRARSTASLPSEGEIFAVPRIVESISLPPYSNAEDLQTEVLSRGSRTIGPADDEFAYSPSPSEGSRRKPRTEANPDDSCPHGTSFWDVSGTYELSLPTGCTQMRVLAWGAGGAGAMHFSGGAGGFARGAFEVDEGTKLSVHVGSGGGAACAPRDGVAIVDFESHGGAHSGVVQESLPLIIAGGGGAAGDLPSELECEGDAAGGAGGGRTGVSGGGAECLGERAGGGQQDRGGNGALGDTTLAGASFRGGRGGGGGGYYGGGGTKPRAGGAAGGSGHAALSATDELLKSGNGAEPAETNAPEYKAPAGRGGMAGCNGPESKGHDGLVVVSW